MNSKITPAQLSPGVFYPGRNRRPRPASLTSRALIAAFVNVRGAQVR
jgi:hypothetical protein